MGSTLLPTNWLIFAAIVTVAVIALGCWLIGFAPEEPKRENPQCWGDE